jgi:hypothetical protein
LCIAAATVFVSVGCTYAPSRETWAWSMRTESSAPAVVVDPLAVPLADPEAVPDAVPEGLPVPDAVPDPVPRDDPPPGVVDDPPPVPEGPPVDPFPDD